MLTLTKFNLLDIVALKESLPDSHLLAGQVGTIVELLAPDVYEVDFSDDQGQTYAMLPLHTSQLLKLHYTPSTQETKLMSTTIHQHGLGDNFGGDKVMGDKIGTQINNSQNLAEAAKDIKELLNQLDTEYDRTTPSGQANIQAKAIEAIDKNPTLKTRTLNALKEGGVAALEEAIDHPVAKVIAATFKGFTDAK